MSIKKLLCKKLQERTIDFHLLKPHPHRDAVVLNKNIHKLFTSGVTQTGHTMQSKGCG